MAWHFYDTSMDAPSISQARELILNAKTIVVFTGAGVSQESGIPTFRDALTGLWSQYEAESLATPEAFVENPKLVWDFYEYRRELIRQCEPNAAHRAIAALEKERQIVVVTQNVDGFHQAVGSSDVIALHGNIFENRCFVECGFVEECSATPSLTGPPICPACRLGLLRPNVVWFGEMLNEAHLSRAFEMVRQCDLLVSIGTSGLVYPAAQIPFLAVGEGKPVIEINPQPTDFTRLATVSLAAPTAEVFPRII